MASDAPVPLLSGSPALWPTHVKEGLSSPTGDAAVDAEGRQVAYKTGGKFTAHRSELLGPDGHLLPVLPLYADTLKAGKIILPYSGAEWQADGGPGYGAVPSRYGEKAWASLHYPRADGDTRTMGSPARKLSKIIAETAAKHGGAIGLVYNGGRGAARGNRAIWQMIHHELAHRAANGDGGAIDRAIEAEPAFKRAGVEKLSDLPRVLGLDTPTATRGEMIENILKRGPKSNKDAGNPLSEVVHSVLDSALDYQHVPSFHGIAVVRFHPHVGGLTHDTNDNSVYHHQARGVYLGELQHSIPLSELLPESTAAYRAERGKLGDRHLQTRTQGNPNMTDPSTPAALAGFAKGISPDGEGKSEESEEERVERMILRAAMRAGNQARLQERLVGAVAGRSPQVLRMPHEDISGEVSKAIGSRHAAIILKAKMTAKEAFDVAKKAGLSPGDSYCPDCGAIFEWGGSPDLKGSGQCNRCGTTQKPVVFNDDDGGA